MLAMVGPVSKIDAGSLEKDHRARDGTEWGRIVWHSIPDSVDFERVKLFASFWSDVLELF
jgi:hypothetical protein